MKKIIIGSLVLTLLLSACGSAPEPTTPTDAPTVPTTVPTQAATEPREDGLSFPQPDSWTDVVLTPTEDGEYILDASFQPRDGAESWLFSVVRLSAAEILESRNTLQNGGRLIARHHGWREDGRIFYLLRTPTDVQYTPETAERYQELEEQITSLWVPVFTEENGLTPLEADDLEALILFEYFVQNNYYAKLLPALGRDVDTETILRVAFITLEHDHEEGLSIEAIDGFTQRMYGLTLPAYETGFTWIGENGNVYCDGFDAHGAMWMVPLWMEESDLEDPDGPVIKARLRSYSIAEDVFLEGESPYPLFLMGDPGIEDYFYREVEVQFVPCTDETGSLYLRFVSIRIPPEDAEGQILAWLEESLEDLAGRTATQLQPALGAWAGFLADHYLDWLGEGLISDKYSRAVLETGEDGRSELRLISVDPWGLEWVDTLYWYAGQGAEGGPSGSLRSKRSGLLADTAAGAVFYLGEKTDCPLELDWCDQEYWALGLYLGQGDSVQEVLPPQALASFQITGGGEERIDLEATYVLPHSDEEYTVTGYYTIATGVFTETGRESRITNDTPSKYEQMWQVEY